MAKPLVLVVNPRAGAGRAAAARGALEQALRQLGPVDTRLTSAPDHATELVREALRAGAPGVAVVGGDGTLNEAINGFFDPDGDAVRIGAWLAPMPIGTGGDFRKTAGIPESIDAMVRRFAHSEPRALDVGWLEYRTRAGAAASRAFINVTSFGLGGVVDRLVNDGPKWLGGRAAFFLGTLRGMREYENQPVQLSLDGGPPIALEVLNVAVANGRYFGGGMRIAPRAVLDDGLFDVVAVEREGVLSQLTLAPALYGGDITRTGVFYRRARTVTAEPIGTRPVELDVDGEALGVLPARFTVRSGLVRLR